MFCRGGEWQAEQREHDASTIYCGTEAAPFTTPAQAGLFLDRLFLGSGSKDMMPFAKLPENGKRSSFIREEKGQRPSFLRARGKRHSSILLHQAPWKLSALSVE